ncbi:MULTISPECIES: IS66 family transposase [Bradyrhizobium]|jgi:hypothetical protein|uniref:Transposase IS66 central domain-containing protein n=1 Tax=Bradyrhizobium elkanii TaxID=29448 RepID=A0A8I1Y328_BRAEL|nr:MULTISPECIES: transposase [Bradyrhizobium]MBP1293599.1 hypothetical protein [Bradyrhizobium elkanii]MCP1925817.1 hypothetical protein [Bradyrhizobium elkanii]MCS3451451.1 hypothetical protein [Bradyrhizobium elkanii]MCS3476691.1 hypothetical protein [Bradyrhizobium elkanii]MCS3566524.1 hypothetical protein [Bradyrhizobium elkanii]
MGRRFAPLELDEVERAELTSLASRRSTAQALALCLAHARRKFVEVYKTTQSPFAREVIERLQAVYAIEVEIRGSSAARLTQACEAAGRCWVRGGLERGACTCIV